MARTLEEILAELNNAEKEYAEKCKKYGIEEKHRKKKETPQLDENGNPITAEGNATIENSEVVKPETVSETSNNAEQG